MGVEAGEGGKGAEQQKEEGRRGAICAGGGRGWGMRGEGEQEDEEE